MSLTQEGRNDLHALTEGHIHALRRDDGGIDYVREMSLLEQLEDAKTQRLNAADGGGSLASLPFGCEPHDLEQDIIRTCYNTLDDIGRGLIAGKPLAVRVKLWAENTVHEHVNDYLALWCEAIRDLSRRKSGLDAECPRCGQAQVRVSSAGETKVRAALILTAEIPRVLCGGCGALWDGIDAVQDLAKILGGGMIVTDRN